MKFKLVFGTDTLSKSILSDVILKTGKPINILRGSIDATSGELIVQIKPEDTKEIVTELEKRGVIVSDLKKTIILDKDKCIQCGACYSICPTNAVRIDRKGDWSISIDEEKCVSCGICAEACPVKAIKIRT